MPSIDNLDHTSNNHIIHILILLIGNSFKNYLPKLTQKVIEQLFFRRLYYYSFFLNRKKEYTNNNKYKNRQGDNKYRHN